MSKPTERTRPRDEDFQMPGFRLDGRVALVTGGSRGLGLGMALALANSGADVAIAARTAVESEYAGELISKTGVEAISIVADLSQHEAVEKLVPKVVEHFGRLDILVNAAGVNIRQPFDTFTEEDYERLMRLNVKAPFFLSQAAAPEMRKTGKGRIINVESIVVSRSIPNISLYTLSKNGLHGMTRSLALELAKDNVTVNGIAPGRFWTKMADAVFSVPERYDSAVSVIPMGRPGIPSDLAGITVLLASDASDYITGQTIYVDGGWQINGGVKA